MPAPIALFVYNRISAATQAIETLQKNHLAQESELFIFSDGPKNRNDEEKVLEVREFIKKIGGFKKVEIIERSVNLGISKSIVGGITDILNSYNKVIVLEDDVVISPYFLQYMNNALDLYEDEKRVSNVCGYFYRVNTEIPETFFLKFFCMWGWATWKRSWVFYENDCKKLLKELARIKGCKDFDLNGNYPSTKTLKKQANGLVNTWDIQLYASSFLRNTLNLFPGKSLAKNIGFGSDSTHNMGPYKKVYDVDLTAEPIVINRIKIEENESARKALEEHFKRTWPGIPLRAICKLERFFYQVRNYLR